LVHLRLEIILSVGVKINIYLKKLTNLGLKTEKGHST
jgi:hypothetical protein